MPHLMFTDETNLKKSDQSQFFNYGGVIIDVSRLRDLHRLIERIRSKYKFKPSDELTFETRSRPDHLSPDQHAQAKFEVLSGCADLDVKFVANLVLHDLARSRPEEKLIEWGANIP